MRGRLLVAAVAAVDVADRNRRELFGREIERGHGDGVERAAERFEVAPRVRADAAVSAERERQVGLEITGRRPTVLGHTGAVEQAKALRPFRKREPRARLRAVRTIAAVRSFVEVEVGLEADRPTVTASRVGLYGHRRLLDLSACILQPVAIYT